MDRSTLGIVLCLGVPGSDLDVGVWLAVGGAEDEVASVREVGWRAQHEPASAPCKAPSTGSRH